MQTAEMRKIFMVCCNDFYDNIFDDVLRKWTDVRNIEQHLRLCRFN